MDYIGVCDTLLEGIIVYDSLERGKLPAALFPAVAVFGDLESLLLQGPDPLSRNYNCAMIILIL